jgi:SAF domain
MPSPPSFPNVGTEPNPRRAAPGARSRQRDGAFQVAAPRRSRPPALLVAAVMLISFFGAVGALLVERAGERRDVLVLGRTVPMGQPLVESDLRVVRVSADPALRGVAGSAVGQVVGKVAATTLLAGTLLTREALEAVAAPAPGRAIVGLDLKGAQLPLPAGMLMAGAQVRVVLTPDDGSQAPTDPGQDDETAAVLVDRATVYSVDAAPEAESVHIAVEVGEADGTAVLRAGAAGRVGLVLLGGAGRGS